MESSLILIIDLLEGLTEEDSVQLHYHFDRSITEVKASIGSVCSISARANAAVRISANIRPLLIPAKVSNRNDDWRDSVIAVMDCPASGQKGRMALATVIVPFPAGQPAFMPGQPVVCWTGDEVSVDFKAGKAYFARYHTREKQLLCRSRNSEEGI